MFQFADFFVPLLRAWPWDIARGIIRVCSLSNWQDETPLYGPLVDYIEVVKTQGINIIVTGHSLGGGMASIGAALTGLKSVGFSPPGIKWSSLKFGIQDMYSLDESMISIYAK
jgi:putative lipase involved disintegration of autophagic bodies